MAKVANKAETIIIAVDGNEAPLSSVHKIGERYYYKHFNLQEKLRNPQHYCIMIDIDGDLRPRRVAPLNREYDWCYTSNSYVKLTDNHVQGIINDQMEKGWFIPNSETINIASIERYDARVESTPCIRAYPNIMRKCVIDGNYYLIPADPKMAKALFEPMRRGDSLCAEMHKRLSPKNISKNGGYNIFNIGSYGQEGNDAFVVAQQESDKYWKENTPKTLLDKYEEALVIKSVGAEFEAESGYVTERDCLNLGLVPVKDGSIRGTSFEYITTVLRENKLSKLSVITNYLNKILTVGDSCSLHFHVGGIDTTPKNTVALYMMFYQLNKEFFEILPPYKKDLQYFQNKKPIKDHCKDLPSLGLFDSAPRKTATESEINAFVKTSFDRILTFLNDGRMPSKSGGRYIHSKEGRAKWEYNSRYYSVNFLPFLFENKKTIEFRSHTPTTNPDKTLNWLFIINAVIKYALENADSIICRKEKINMTDCIEHAYMEKYPELSEYLKAYVLERKASHDDLYQSGDIYGKEFENDNSYKFSHKNRKLIYG